MQPHHITTTEYACETCGKLYSRPTAMARRSKHHFCSNACWRTWNRGAHHGSWKAGVMQHPSGYIRITVPEGGNAVWEHRYVWEQANGPIPAGFEIHHINHNRADNRLENLELLSEHEHRSLRHALGRWSKLYDRCQECGTQAVPHMAHGLCNKCHEKHRPKRHKA